MKRSVGERVLLFAVCLMAFLVMLGHVTALLYIDIGVLALTLAFVFVAHRTRREPMTLPPRRLLLAFGLWAAWGALSVCWSTDPGLSIRGWLDEIGYPFIVFIAFHYLAACRDDLAPDRSPAQVVTTRGAPGRTGWASQNTRWLAFSCLAGSIVLAYLSISGFRLLPGNLPKPGLLHYYAGVGQASTVALFVMPWFMLMSVQRRTMAFGILGLVCASAIGAATLNRFFYVSAACVLAIGYWPLLKCHRMVAAAVGVVLIVGATVMIIHSSAERDLELQPAGVQAASVDANLQHIVSRDTRPLIWRFYLDKAMHRPLLGIGFGKRLPNRTFGDSVPPSLLDVEAQAATHAHNMFLNTLLEVGAIGLVLQCVLFATMLRTLAAFKRQPWLLSAGVALVVGMISKNLTDDFMWQSTMLAFWGHYGWLLGRMSRMSQTAPRVDVSSSSPV